MSDTVRIYDLLVESIPLFEKRAVECMDAIFQCQGAIAAPWSVSDRIEGEFDHIFSLGCANSASQGIIVVGVANEYINSFVTVDSGIELIDIFGEFANTYCGMMMDEQQIIRRFGILTQAVPQHSLAKSFFPRAWGVHGKVVSEGRWMYIGFAIREKQNESGDRLKVVS